MGIEGNRGSSARRTCEWRHGLQERRARRDSLLTVAGVFSHKLHP
jgi:hypothetical protein